MSESTIPAVSVIIPTFNRRETVGRAIQSVLAQTFQDFEIIIVDDGSTDETKKLIEELWRPQFLYLRHDGNRGAAAARNTGIHAARGRYLAFLDSDDEWLPEKLSSQVALFDDRSDHIDIICSGHISVTCNREMEYTLSPQKDWFKRMLWTCDLCPGSTLIVRQECIEETGMLDERFILAEDWDWLLRLSREHRLAVIEKPLARIHRASLPCADLVEASMQLFLDKHDEEFCVFGPRQRRRIIAKHYLELSFWFCREKRFFRGSYYLFKAFTLNPVQNPFFIAGICFAVVDALCSTSIASWALEYKHRIGNALLKRKK